MIILIKSPKATTFQYPIYYDYVSIEHKLFRKSKFGKCQPKLISFYFKFEWLSIKEHDHFFIKIISMNTQMVVNLNQVKPNKNSSSIFPFLCTITKFFFRPVLMVVGWCFGNVKRLQHHEGSPFLLSLQILNPIFYFLSIILGMLPN